MEEKRKKERIHSYPWEEKKRKNTLLPMEEKRKERKNTFLPMEEQDPLVYVMSSTAMSPLSPRPFTASIIICQEKWGQYTNK